MDTECTEHTRLCFAWHQPTTTFIIGSVVTGVSSLCIVAEYDLKKYQELLDKMGDASLEIEAVLDDFPMGAEQHRNVRYNATRRTQDTQYEEEQFLVIESLLNRYQNERVRLTELQSDDKDGVDDVEETRPGTSGGFGLLSHTQTHYPFTDANQLHLLTNPGLKRDDHGLGLGMNKLTNQGLQSWLAAAHQSATALPGNDEDARTITCRAVSEKPSTTPLITVSSPSDQPPTTSQMQPSTPIHASTDHSGPKSTPVPTTEVAVSPPRKMSHAATTTSIVSLTTTTLTTSSTVTTPSASILADGRATWSNASRTERRRSSSEGLDVRGPASRDSENDQLFRVRQLVATRSKTFSQNIDTVLTRARDTDRRAGTWLQDEIRNCQRDMDRLEELECTAWMLIDKLEGKVAQKKRIEKWRDWHARQVEKIRQAKSLSWDASRSETTSLREDRPRSCHRSAGHVEKVKLPTFTGRQEDFSEFRNQFRELCAGERYTPVLELAQLKTKLPREALYAISGLQCPEEAWKRLEELYGNRELSILSAIKNLREFKTTKYAAHEQVIELAMATQKCMTELGNIHATEDLLGDRESVACIVMALPPTVRDKWYNIEVPEETLAKGKFLVKWLEKQRQNAVRVRLDTMAAKLHTPVAPPGKSGNASASSESTDKGLISSSLHAQGSDRGGNPQGGAGKAQGIPKEPADDKTGRVDVKTTQDAVKVAERRKASLEARKLDKCPVCDQNHFYERTWTSIQPPVKAKLLSTHLTTCSRFLAMSSNEKLATVLGNSACLHCASWDHATHKFQGGKPAKDPKCAIIVGGVACGGAHGRWFHDGSGDGGSHSVVAATSVQGPGLYEVYLVTVHAAQSDQGQDGRQGMVMVDPGSDTTFIRHEFAHQLGLVGNPCHFRLKVVDREARPIETSRYEMIVEDCQGGRHVVSALGLETITILPPDPDLTPLRDLANHLPDAAFNRPQGDVDILLGLRDSALHGSTEQQWGNLRLLKSPLGCGWSWRGTHPDLQYTTTQMPPSLSAAAYAIRNASQDQGDVAHLYHIQNVREFHKLDEARDDSSSCVSPMQGLSRVHFPPTEAHTRGAGRRIPGLRAR